MGQASSALRGRFHIGGGCACAPDEDSAPGNGQPFSRVADHLDPHWHHQINAQNHAADEKQNPDRPRQEAPEQNDDPQEYIANNQEERHQEGGVERDSKALKQRTLSYGLKEVRGMKPGLQRGIKMGKQRIEESINKEESCV